MNRTHRPLALSQISLLALLVALTGCVSAKMYRPDSVEEQEDYTLTFIEFDDQGEPLAPVHSACRSPCRAAGSRRSSLDPIPLPIDIKQAGFD